MRLNKNSCKKKTKKNYLNFRVFLYFFVDYVGGEAEMLYFLIYLIFTISIYNLNFEFIGERFGGFLPFLLYFCFPLEGFETNRFILFPFLDFTKRTESPVLLKLLISLIVECGGWKICLLTTFPKWSFAWMTWWFFMKTWSPVAPPPLTSLFAWWYWREWPMKSSPCKCRNCCC